MRFDEHILTDPSGKPIIKAFHSSVNAGKRIYREHHHTECELSLFIEGSGIYTTAHRELSFNKGDMFMFAADEKHCITYIRDPINILNIHFEPRLIWESTETAELLQFIFCSNGKNKFNASDMHLRSLIEAIEREITEQHFGYIIETKGLIFSALIHIIRTYYNELETVPSFVQNDITKKLKEVISYIEDNLDAPLTLHELSDIACMSQTYFSSIFKKYNGISPWNYITIKRIEKAIYLLKTTNMKKLEIAERCGFSSSSNFYKAFRLITGKQPSDFQTKDVIQK